MGQVLGVAGRGTSAGCGRTWDKCWVWPDVGQVLGVAGRGTSAGCGRTWDKCWVWPDVGQVLGVAGRGDAGTSGAETASMRSVRGWGSKTKQTNKQKQTKQKQK